MCRRFDDWDEYAEKIKEPRRHGIEIEKEPNTYNPYNKTKLIAEYSAMEVMYWINKTYGSEHRHITTPSGARIQLTRTLKLFRLKGLDCVICDMRGEFFKEWFNGKESSLALYGIRDTKRGPRHILMTADHIIPIARGGPNGFDNLQPMCADCNNKKGSKIIQRIELKWVDIHSGEIIHG